MPLNIGISLGDFTGIGPETVLKAIAAELGTDQTRYLLIGDPEPLRELNERLGLKLPAPNHERADSSARLVFYNPENLRLPPNLEPGSPVAARAAVAWLKAGAQLALKQEIDALVTAPVNKESIIRAGVPFVGQTEFLSELADARRTAMMLLGHDKHGVWLRVALATTHLAIKDVSSHLTRNNIEVAVELASQACRDLGLPRARIGICGLNPHAGEGGKIGTEEQTLIAPVVAGLQGRGYDVFGPVSADALFHYAYKGDYDAVVAMYHDQGLVPLKMIAFEHGVNWTLGLPFIRTSPDHGTAYDIAGQNRANPSSMRAALRLARQLAADKARGKAPNTKDQAPEKLQARSSKSPCKTPNSSG